jgi:hypothetical protein
LHLHAVFGAQGAGHFLEQVAAPRDKQQVVAAAGQAVRIDFAEASRCARDDGGAGSCLFAHFESIQNRLRLKHDDHHV